MMNVLVRINDCSFQYDAYHLVKSFYQDEEVAVEPLYAGETDDVHGGARKSEARICVDIVIDSNGIRAFYLEQEAVNTLKESAQDEKIMKKAEKIAQEKTTDLFLRAVSSIDSEYDLFIELY